MDKKAVFFSDLDRTLIYSKKFLKDSIDTVCIEKKGEKEISYMTKEALSLLQEVKEETLFIPVSTRTYETMTRVDFIQQDLPEWMICDNGAHIYHNGKLVEEWEAKMKEKSSRLHLSIQRFEEILRQFFADQGFKEIINREDLYLMVKFQEMTGEIRCMLEVLSLTIREYGYRIDVNSRKAYLLPDFIRKEDAVKYLIELNGYENTISAGDSLMDLGMLEVTDYAIAPKHKTFLEATMKVTEHKGLRAGTEILHFIKDFK